LKFRIKALIDVALFQILNATFGRGIMLTASGSGIGRIMAFCLKNFVNFLALSCRNYLFPVPVRILQIYDLIRQQKFQILTHISVFGNSVTTACRCVNFNFRFLFLTRCFFFLYFFKTKKEGKTSFFGTLCRYFTLKFSLMQIYIFN